MENWAIFLTFYQYRICYGFCDTSRSVATLMQRNVAETPWRSLSPIFGVGEKIRLFAQKIDPWISMGNM